MAGFVEGDGRVVDAWSTIHPFLGFIKVDVAGEMTSIRRWVERVGEDVARAIEGEAVLVVRLDEADDKVRGAGMGFLEGEWGDPRPVGEDLGGKETYLRVTKVRGGLHKAIGQVHLRPLVAMDDELAEGSVWESTARGGH
jgi:hypothetical protein